jgi:hypothetical protein
MASIIHRVQMTAGQIPTKFWASVNFHTGSDEVLKLLKSTTPVNNVLRDLAQLIAAPTNITSVYLLSR